MKRKRVTYIILGRVFRTKVIATGVPKAQSTTEGGSYRDNNGQER